MVVLFTRYRNLWRFKKFLEIDIINSSSELLHEQFMTFLFRERIISRNYPQIARKSIGEFCKDNSLPGLSDNQLKHKIEKLCPFEKLSFEDKVWYNE